MRRHQVGIRLVLRVAIAIIDDRIDFLAEMPAHVVRVASGVAAALVNVVASVEDEVEGFVGDAPVGSEETGFVLTAAADAEAQAVDDGTRRRSGLGAASLADFTAAPESIPVLTRRGQAAGFHVHAVAELRSRGHGAVAHDRPERLIRGDLPADFDVGGRHAAAGERLRRKPRPQRNAVGPRVARRHSERERIGPERRLCPRHPRHDRLRDRRDAEFPRDVQQLATGEPAERAIVEANRVVGGHELEVHLEADSSQRV